MIKDNLLRFTRTIKMITAFAFKILIYLLVFALAGYQFFHYICLFYFLVLSCFNTNNSGVIKTAKMNAVIKFVYTSNSIGNTKLIKESTTKNATKK